MDGRRRARAAISLAAAFASASLMLPAAAPALEAQIVASELSMTDPGGLPNKVSITVTPADQLRVSDTAGMTIGPSPGGCLAETPQSVVCPASAVLTIAADLGGANDELGFDPDFASAGTFVHAGSGKDSIKGTDNGDEIFGGAGNDVLRGGRGSDGITGGRDSDSVFGGAGNDDLTGNPGADRCDGGGGNDECSGGGGRDRCNGGDGDDTCLGGGDRDRCDGGPGRDLAFACEILRRIESKAKF